MREIKYESYGKEWEKEAIKLPKEDLILIIRKLSTGTEDVKIAQIETANEANHIVEGIINDYSGGIIDKSETMRLLGEYTGRLMELFFNNAKKLFNEHPHLLNRKD